MRCAKCDLEIGGPERAVASISAEVMGDEYIESYWLCKKCGVYTKEVFRDSFTTGAHVTVSGPIPRQDGDAEILGLRGCPTPHDKNCRCDAHRQHYGEGWLT